MTGRLYQTVGFSMDTLRLLDEARRHPAFLEFYGRSNTYGDVIEWVVRHGVIRIRTDPVINQLEASR